MEPLREIKRVFPNCGVCGSARGQCCCPAARNEREALTYYMLLRPQLVALESRENTCECGEFYKCDLCRESDCVRHEMKELMIQWGDHWAVCLWANRDDRSIPHMARQADVIGNLDF